MGLTFVSLGEKAVISTYFVNNTVTYHLNTVSFTVSYNQSKANYTAGECSVAGYAAFTAATNSWTFGGGGPEIMNYQQTITWTMNTGPVTALGYWCESGGTLLYAEEFASSYVVGSGGGSFCLCPTVSCL